VAETGQKFHFHYSIIIVIMSRNKKEKEMNRVIEELIMSGSRLYKVALHARHWIRAKGEETLDKN
jgi:hypothetical protein